MWHCFFACIIAFLALNKELCMPLDTFIIHDWGDVVTAEGVICCCKMFLLYGASACFPLQPHFTSPLPPFPVYSLFFCPISVVQGYLRWAVVATWVCSTEERGKRTCIMSFRCPFSKSNVLSSATTKWYLSLGLPKDRESEWVRLFSEDRGSSGLFALLDTSLWKLKENVQEI